MLIILSMFVEIPKDRMDIQEKLAIAAIRLAEDMDADAILTLTESGRVYELISERVKDRRVVAATPQEETYEKLKVEAGGEIIKLSVRDPDRMKRVRHAVWKGLQNNIFSPGELLTSLVGGGRSSGMTDTLSVYRISETEHILGEMVESDPVMGSVVEIAAELGWEGRRGEPIGTAFMVGDHEKVLNQSRQLGVNPFKGHESIQITDKKNREMVKEYAFLDGAFVLDSEGKLVAAGRFLDADVDVDIPKGLGTRHIATASMTAATHSKGVTISGTDGAIRIFEDGEIVLKIDSKSKLIEEVSI